MASIVLALNFGYNNAAAAHCILDSNFNWFSNVVFDFLKRCISGKFKNNTD